MNDQFKTPQNAAQDYYPKALNLSPTDAQNAEPQTPQNSPFSSLLSNFFGGENAPGANQMSQLFGGNPLLSSLLTGNLNQSDLLAKLMSSFSPKNEVKDEKERVIDLSNSIEEL